MSDSQRKPRYILRPVVTPVAGAQPTKSAASKSEASSDPFLRPAQEDDDGYDPFSDRPPTPEPTFQEDPWRYENFLFHLILNYALFSAVFYAIISA